MFTARRVAQYVTERRVVYLVTLTLAIALLAVPSFDTHFVRAVFATWLTLWSGRFTFRYWRGSNWKSSQVGKSLLYLDLTITILGVYISVALWTRGEYFLYGELGTLIYAGLGATMMLMDRQLTRIQKGVVIPGSSNDPEAEPPKLTKESSEI